MAKLPVVPHQPNFEFIRCALQKSVLPLALKVFTVIRMNEIDSRAGSPLVESDTEILERYVIGVKWRSIRPRKYADVLRREFQNLSKLCLLRADFVFRSLALFDVDTCAVPLDDFSSFVAQWHIALQEPAVFTISAPHA